MKKSTNIVTILTVCILGFLPVTVSAKYTHSAPGGSVSQPQTPEYARKECVNGKMRYYFTSAPDSKYVESGLCRPSAGTKKHGKGADTKTRLLKTLNRSSVLFDKLR